MAAIAALVVEGAIGFILIGGLAVSFPRVAQETLAVFRVTPPLPPVTPPVIHPDIAKSGKASPANLRAKAAPIVAPPIPMPAPPKPAALRPAEGTAAHSGAASTPGPGSGAGGNGDGLGAGDGGDGEGAGGADAVLIRGRILDSDDPRDPEAAQRRAIVYLRFTVGIDGRVSDCRVTRSSGNTELDDLTCRLIIKRFRYRPARDATGRVVPEQIDGDHVWDVAQPPSDTDDRDR